MLSTCTVFGAMKEEHQVNNMVGPKFTSESDKLDPIHVLLIVIINLFVSHFLFL